MFWSRAKTVFHLAARFVYLPRRDAGIPFGRLKFLSVLPVTQKITSQYGSHHELWWGIALHMPDDDEIIMRHPSERHVWDTAKELSSLLHLLLNEAKVE